MIELTIFTSAGRQTVLVSPESQLKTVLDDNDVNYRTTLVQVDGVAADISTLSKTFTQLGVTGKCSIAAITKTGNAA